MEFQSKVELIKKCFRVTRATTPANSKAQILLAICNSTGGYVLAYVTVKTAKNTLTELSTADTSILYY